MLHPLPLPLSSCLGCIPPLIGLPSLRFYAVGSSLFLLSVCFCLCSLFYRDDVLCWLLLARPFLYVFHAHLRFPVDLVWFRLSCDHGWIRSGSVNVRKQQQQQQLCRYGNRTRPSRHVPATAAKLGPRAIYLGGFHRPHCAATQQNSALAPCTCYGSNTRPSRHSSPGPRTATILGARIMIDGITGKYTRAPTLYRIALMTRSLNFSKWLTRSLPQR